MTIYDLKKRLSTKGVVKVLKEGYVLTLFMMGEGLHKWTTISEIQSDMMEYAGERYPVIEVFINDSNFLCMVLKPNKTEG